MTVVSTTSAATVQAGGVIDLQVRADCDGGQIQNVELPDLSQFDVLGRSMSQPMQFQMGAGGGTRVQVAVIHTLRLRARQPGRVQIGPATAYVNGRPFRGNAIDIEVLPAGAQAPGGVTGGQTIPGQSLPAPGSQDPAAGSAGVLDGANVDSVAFLRTLAEPAEPFVGQQVTVSLLFYTRVSARNLQPEREISTDGFWIQDLISPTSPPPRSRREVINGVPYDVHVVRHFAAFPLEAGDLVLGAPRVSMVAGGGFMFGRRPEQMVREGVPVTIRVRPLPQPVPARAVVGRYGLRAQLDRDQVRTGDAVTFSVLVDAEGNLRDVELPTPTVPGLRALRPRSEDHIEVRGARVGGTRRIEWLLVAEQPGTYTIPPVELPVFDPYSERYTTIHTEALTLVVAGQALTPPAGAVGAGVADAGTATQPASGAPDAESASLSPGQIRARSELLRAEEPLSSKPWYWASLAATPLFFFLFWGWSAHRERRSQRNQSADRVAAAAVKERVEAAKRATKAGDVTAFYAAVAAAIRSALEASLAASVGSLTLPQLRDRLEAAGMAEDLRVRVVEELEGCDFARFSASAGSPDEMQRCLKRVQAMVQRLERFRPEGGRGGDAALELGS